MRSIFKNRSQILKQVDVFTKTTGLGNRAAVAKGFSGNEHVMQRMASQINYPVTTYLMNSSLGDCVSKLRFFSPRGELAMCGHGTLAAGAILLEQANQVKVETQQSSLVLHKQGDGLIQLALPQAEDVPVDVTKSKVCGLLGVSADRLDEQLPFCAASVGIPILLVPVKTKDDLWNLSPQKKEILEFTTALNMGGLYVYTTQTTHRDSTLHARCFNPRFNNNFEDVATGAAAAALASVYQRAAGVISPIIIEQGEILQKDSKIHIMVDTQTGGIKLGGYLSIASLDLNVILHVETESEATSPRNN